MTRTGRSHAVSFRALFQPIIYILGSVEMTTDDLNNAREDNILASQYKWIAYVYDPVVWGSSLFAGGERSWRRKFCHFINPNPEENIVELCCGTGALTLQLAKYADPNRLAASDLSPHQLRIARFKAKILRKRIHYSMQDASTTRYESSCFDKVIISDALHEIKKSRRNAIYNEVKRILKAGGGFYISEPIPKGIYARMIFNMAFGPFNPERATALELIDGGLERELIEAGFKIEDHEFTNIGNIKNLRCSCE